MVYRMLWYKCIITFLPYLCVKTAQSFHATINMQIGVTLMTDGKHLADGQSLAWFDNQIIRKQRPFCFTSYKRNFRTQGATMSLNRTGERWVLWPSGDSSTSPHDFYYSQMAQPEDIRVTLHFAPHTHI